MLGLIKKVYSYRGEIGAIAFFILYPFFSPKEEVLLWTFLLLGVGLFLRAWARGYIGEKSASEKMEIREVHNSGIYKIRHPLYLGNFFLTLGVLLYASPPTFLFFLFFSLFLIEYLSFIYLEEVFRKGKKSIEEKFSLKRSLLEVKTVFILFLIFFLLYLKTWKGS
ncbi:MAG: hypothetical protein ABIK99_03365 [candidate division WOR-3 bacterium]